MGGFRAPELPTEWDLEDLLRHDDPKQRPSMEVALAILDSHVNKELSPGFSSVLDCLERVV